jgi:hypothetical protein
MANEDKILGGTMYITLNQYLAQLKNRERSKPEEKRREVPSIVALAQAIGIHPITLSNIANNNVTRFNLATGAAIIDEMRRRGFRMEASDLITYRTADIDIGEDESDETL